MQQETHSLSRLAEDLIGSFRRIPADDASRGKRRPTVSIKDLVESLCSKHGIGRVTLEQGLRDQWPQIVGPANAGYSHVVRLDERGSLIVQASHAVVRNELFMHKDEVLKRIREIPGCAAVKQLRFVQG